MTIITLTSDFGLIDPYVGIMKGVILGIAPDVRLVDLTHEIPPQDVEEAAYAIQSATPYFPADTVHLVIVDPGVGSSRRPLLVTSERGVFVGPDNGLFSFALHEPGASAWVLDRSGYWLPQPSRTFHGRDVFAPVAAHLASGIAPARLATPVADPVALPLSQPQRTGNDEITGFVMHVDHFGNLITNVPGTWLDGRHWTCQVAGAVIAGPRETYAAAERGEVVLLIGSSGMAEVAVRDGNAAAHLHVHRGEPVIFRSKSRS